MRAILKLLAVGSVIAMFGIAWAIDVFELDYVGAAMLVALPFEIWLIDRGHRKRIAGRTRTTMDVIPLPSPAGVPDDVEGVTVRAPMSHQEAYEMHARYSPSFDQQAMLHRYVEEHGDDAAIPEAVPEQDPPGFDQHRYANALQYADAFDAQLTQARRTQAYQVAQPKRIARGSYTPAHYDRQRSDQSLADQWDTGKTQIGVHPLKRK